MRTPLGEISAATVVLAAGSASTKLARSLGIEIPQRFVRQTVVLTEPVAPVTRTAAWTGDLFIRQDKSGSLRLAGATRNEVVLDPTSLRHSRLYLRSYLANRSQLRLRVDPRGLARAATRLVASAGSDVAIPAPDGDDVAFCLERIRGYFPELPEIRLLRAWAGEIDATPDALPVLDASAGPSGLVVATGMSGHGFGVSPVIGEIVAALGERQGRPVRPEAISRQPLPRRVAARAGASALSRSAQPRPSRAASTRPSNTGKAGWAAPRHSGCHCSPTMKRLSGYSTASTMPSGAQATGTSPFPGRATPW